MSDVDFLNYLYKNSSAAGPLLSVQRDLKPASLAVIRVDRSDPLFANMMVGRSMRRKNAMAICL